jgi:hypothetical protein
MDVSTLIAFVQSHDIQPDWLQMQVPGGRSHALQHSEHHQTPNLPLLGRNMNQCFRAAENMFNVQIQPPTMPQLKRKSLGDLTEPYSKRQAIASPIEQHPYPLARGFGPQPASTQLPSLPQSVHIQPRPSPNGYVASPVTSSPTIPAALPMPTPTTGRRRGRPTKAEKEAQTRANNPQGTGYAPISPAPIAPLPGYTPSPSNAPPPAYQAAPGASSSEPRSNRRGRPSGSDKQTTAANVPRTTQAPVADVGTQKMPPGDFEGTERWDRPPGSTSQGPIPLEPPIQSRGSVLPQAGPSPRNPIIPGALRDIATPSVEQGRNDDHPPVDNQA